MSDLRDIVLVLLRIRPWLIESGLAPVARKYGPSVISTLTNASLMTQKPFVERNVVISTTIMMEGTPIRIS
jgi:hypothetical protein